MSTKFRVSPVAPANLDYTGSALDAFDTLATSQSNYELLQNSHRMWCGRSCDKNQSCSFLHYPRSDPPAAPARTARSRYNKQTAHLYNLMGGSGYESGVSRIHEVNTWPLLEAVLKKVDVARQCGGLLHCDYTDWTKKRDTSADQLTRSTCRDAIQWMASWCGADYSASPVGLHYVALSTIVDDLCIPPLDVVHGRFSMYGRTCRDLMQAMDQEHWGVDGIHLLLSLLRQYLFQYAEKVDFENGLGHIGLHTQLSQTRAVWDSVVYRTHTANTYGAAIVIGRVAASGPLMATWLVDSAICDAISMDLAKSGLRVYEQDNHIPTDAGTNQAGEQMRRLERERRTEYHSVYLDLIDDLVDSGAPDAIVHFGRSGFLFFQIQDRYLERRAGRRFAIRPTMATQLNELFGDKPTDSMLDGLFRLRWIAENGNEISSRRRDYDNKTTSFLAPELSSACQMRQSCRRLTYSLGEASMATSVLPTWIGNGSCECSRVWADEVHSKAAEATSPGTLVDLLTGGKASTFRMTADQLATIASPENIWALCVSCQVGCTGHDCEWMSLAKYTWKLIGAPFHGEKNCISNPSARN